jgi:hypothetical protein
MISKVDVAQYRREGFIVVPDVLSPAEIADLRRVTDEFVEASRKATSHTDIFDLEPGHTAEQPRLRRIKTPSLHHPVYARMVRHPGIVAVLNQLWGRTCGSISRSSTSRRPASAHRWSGIRTGPSTRTPTTTLPRWAS